MRVPRDTTRAAPRTRANRLVERTDTTVALEEEFFLGQGVSPNSGRPARRARVLHTDYSLQSAPALNFFAAKSRVLLECQEKAPGDGQDAMNGAGWWGGRLEFFRTNRMQQQ